MFFALKMFQDKGDENSGHPSPFIIFSSLVYFDEI